MDAVDSRHSTLDTAAKTIEGGVRSLVSGKRAASVATLSCDGLAAGQSSIADIENLMAELLVARDYLQAEGDRVRRINANYSHLAQTASASVKVIAESIGQWCKLEQESGNRTVIGRVPVPALSAGSEGELQPDSVEPSP